MKRSILPLCVALAPLFWLGIAQAQSNSIVRFRFSHDGVRLGDVDFELFDQDKPITVSNFLAYVQSGRYDNSLLSRCIPDFVIQGGEYSIANPYSDAPFEQVTRVPFFANITNEFAVGTYRSNVFGTLAMSKVPGDPNSANSGWFINLTNNAVGTNGDFNLDLQNGGFTVFGQVKSGQNVLKTFNTFSLYNRILNQEDLFHIFTCPPLYENDNPNNIGFESLPVAFKGQYCPIYSDLFTVEVLQMLGPDLLPPKVVIATPATASVTNTLLNTAVLVTGTAVDALGVASVRIYLNTNTPVVATGSNSWSLTLTNVPPGTNIIDVEAIDQAGNRGRASRTFFNSVRVPLTLLTSGAGTVSGATNSQLLELTRPYTLVAQPNPGNLFGIWTGSFNEVSTTLKFNMETNTAFTAIFTSNLFPYAKGVYNGLFYDTNQVQQQSSGFMTLTLGDFGGYSGKLLMNGRTFRLAGAFGVDGGETNTVLLSDTENMRLLLYVNLNGGNQITGQVTNRNWTSQLLMDRAVFHATTNPAPWAGNYTFLIPPDTNGVAGPEGESYGTLKVDNKGGVTVKGVLADTTPLSLKTSVSKDGHVPLYLGLYKGFGALVSWAAFDTNQPTTDLSGLLNWIKQPQVYAKFYFRGFTNEMTLQGSRYVAPLTGPAIALTNGTVGFTNGNSAGNFANNVTLGADNKVINNGTNKLTLTITKSTGLMSGTVMPLNNPRTLPFKGAVLQKQNRGAGFLAGSNRTTQVRLERAP